MQRKRTIERLSQMLGHAYRGLELPEDSLRGLSNSLYLYRFQIKPLRARLQAILKRNSCPVYPAAPRIFRKFCGLHFVAASRHLMPRPLHFVIRPFGALCEQVLALGLSSFDRLTAYVKSLPYGRTADTADPRSVLREQRGTCSSKHQLLAAVAHECGHFEVQLTVGIYEMSEQNTPGVGIVLSSASLASVPEAHCYLTVGSERFDFTGLTPGTSSPFDALLEEHVVSPEDLSQTKVRLHMRAVAAWAPGAGVSAASAWATREACIATLANPSIEGTHSGLRPPRAPPVKR